MLAAGPGCDHKLGLPGPVIDGLQELFVFVLPFVFQCWPVRSGSTRTGLESDGGRHL